MRKLAGVALVSIIVAAVTLPPATADEPMDRAKWPAYVEGKYRRKTFRFRPGSVEYRRAELRRAPAVWAIFRIKEPGIPADYFMTRLPGRLKEQPEDYVKKLLAADDGFIRVNAYWVNPARPKAEWKGGPEPWVEGRALLGVRRRRQTRERRAATWLLRGRSLVRPCPR